MRSFPYILPEQASTYAERVDPLFYTLTIFVGVFTITILGILIYFGLRYRKLKGENRPSVHQDIMPLELTWTAIPTVIALAIFAWGSVLYYDYSNIPENTLDINVIGKRWMWKMQHPNGLREVNKLHIPVGQPVKLTMTSQDVIHSFYVPAFRVKQDVLPARYTTLWFEATRTGTFPLFCAEYCGTDHSTMVGEVVVMEPHEYEQWLEGGPALSPVAAGEQLFQQQGCYTCHMAGEFSRGPALDDLFGNEVRLRTGEMVIADEEYLRESITNPSAKVVEGYAPIMPSFANLSEDQVMDLVAYIKTLTE